MPEAYYLITYELIALPDNDHPGLEMIAVSASTFIDVENWAFDHVPSGYSVMNIEKNYGVSWGEADVVINEYHQPKNYSRKV